MSSDQKLKVSEQRSEKITQGRGLRKAMSSDQKLKVSDQTKSESNGHNKNLYNKEALSSDQKLKVSEQRSEKIIQGRGLRKAMSSDQKLKVSDQTKSESNGHNKNLYNKEAMSSDQKLKVSEQRSEKIIQGRGLRKAMSSDQKPKVSDQTKLESNGHNKNLYNKEAMSSDQKPIYNKETMNNLKVTELREIARSRGLKGWYRLRKSDLISFITSEERRRQSEATEETKEQLVERRRQERLEKAAAEAKAKAEKKAKSKARRQVKREESRREAERRAEVKRVKSNQKRQRAENIAGERPSGKETKSQKKQRQRLEKQAKQAETQHRAHEKAQKKNPKKNRKEKKRQHKATKKEAKRKLNALQQRRLTEPARPEAVINAINGNVRRWTISGEGYITPEDFLNSVRDGVKEVVDGVDGPKKAYAVLKCVLVKHNLKTGDRIFSDFNGHSKTHTVTAELGETYEEMKEKMLESLSKFQKEGSGWQLYLIKGLDISVVKFNPLSGSGYSKLPPLIAKKKAVINMKNDDDQCFKWVVTRALNPTDNHPERVTKELRDQAEKLNWDGITFPVKTKDIHIWEKNNDKIVNVFGYEEDTKKVYVIRMSDGCSSTTLKDQDKFISLFLHDDNHYCVVKDLSRLVTSQISKHKEPKHFCLNCMNGFRTEKILTSHQEFCLNRRPQTEVFPNPGETTKFKNYERLHDVPFTWISSVSSSLWKPKTKTPKNLTPSSTKTTSQADSVTPSSVRSRAFTRRKRLPKPLPTKVKIWENYSSKP